MLCFQIAIPSANSNPLFDLLTRIFTGLLIGIIAGFVLAFIIRKHWIPEENRNIFTIAVAILIFTLSDLIAHESGLLSVTIAGFVLGCLDIPEVKKLKIYKAELIELLIGLLFVLLAAKLKIAVDI